MVTVSGTTTFTQLMEASCMTPWLRRLVSSVLSQFIAFVFLVSSASSRMVTEIWYRSGNFSPPYTV